ncbi:MAG: hypothetical protein MUP98_14900, partial [Candidatus Aminicenantes bacterium]|nr:hypothetical protein [Candidatus Aminicenantes bacterium]
IEERMKYSNTFADHLKLSVPGSKVIEIEELERIKIQFETEGGTRIIGWGKDWANDLPIGSTLDNDTKAFYWMPGPGFLHTQVLHFAVTDGLSMSRPVQIVIHIEPKKYKIKEKETHKK